MEGKVNDKRTLYVGAPPRRHSRAAAAGDPTHSTRTAHLSPSPPATRPRPPCRAGGLEESVTSDIIRAAFVPFGELLDVNLPVDSSTQKHRGFAFVQFDERTDAADAMDNMDGAELFGRVLKVNVAKPDATGRGSHRPVWETRADDFFTKADGEGGDDAGGS